MQWKAKGVNKQTNSVKMQPRKVKIMKIKTSWGPLKVWGAQGSPPPPQSGPASLVPRLLFAEGREKCDLGTRLTGDETNRHRFMS